MSSAHTLPATQVPWALRDCSVRMEPCWGLPDHCYARLKMWAEGETHGRRSARPVWRRLAEPSRPPWHRGPLVTSLAKHREAVR